MDNHLQALSKHSKAPPVTTANQIKKDKLQSYSKPHPTLISLNPLTLNEIDTPSRIVQTINKHIEDGSKENCKVNFRQIQEDKINNRDAVRQKESVNECKNIINSFQKHRGLKKECCSKTKLRDPENGSETASLVDSSTTLNLRHTKNIKPNLMDYNRPTLTVNLRHTSNDSSAFNHFPPKPNKNHSSSSKLLLIFAMVLFSCILMHLLYWNENSSVTGIVTQVQNKTPRPVKSLKKELTLPTKLLQETKSPRKRSKAKRIFIGGSSELTDANVISHRNVTSKSIRGEWIQKIEERKDATDNDSAMKKELRQNV